MNRNQCEQFNRMREALMKIHRLYLIPSQLRRQSYGLEPYETLEMSYENIQVEAKRAVKGVRKAALPVKPEDKE